MAKTIKEWFDKEIKMAKDKSEKRTHEGEAYYLGYGDGMKTAKGKLLKEEII